MASPSAAGMVALSAYLRASATQLTETATGLTRMAGLLDDAIKTKTEYDTGAGKTVTVPIKGEKL